jgi:hypothetical protein
VLGNAAFPVRISCISNANTGLNRHIDAIRKHRRRLAVCGLPPH